MKRLKNIGWILLALILGGAVNMILVMVGSKLVAIPNGIDISTYDGLKKAVPLFSPMNYLFPFLAHAFGTLVSAWLAAKWLTERTLIVCSIIGALYFVGGLMDVMALNGAMWFNILDLTVAYFPMAILGWYLANSSRKIVLE